MAETDSEFENMPACARQYINSVVRRIKYSRAVRREVRLELIDHFEDFLHNCTDDQERQERAEQLIQQFGDAKLLGLLIRRGKKRCRPLWKKAIVRSLQAAGVMIILLIVYTAWFLTGKPTIRTDYLAILNQMSRSPATDQDNAWPHYQRAIELYVEPRGEIYMLAMAVVWHPDIYRSFGGFSKDEKKDIGEWIGNNEAAWAKYVAGSKKTYFWREYETGNSDSELDSVLLEHLTCLWRISKIGIWRVRMAMEDEQIEQAFAECLAMVRTGRMLEGKRFLPEQLVGLSVSKLAHRQLLYIASSTKASVSELLQVQERLKTISQEAYPLINIEIERLIFVDRVQRCFTEGGPSGGHLVPNELSSFFRTRKRGLDELMVNTVFSFIHAGRNRTLAKGNEVYDQLIDAVKMTPYERFVGEINDQEIRGNIDPYRFFILQAPLLSFCSMSDRAHRGKALHQATVTVLALRRWQLEKGQYPENLGQLLASGYVNALPDDPYCDAILKYERRDDDFVLYSLGDDFDDDWGTQNADDAWGEDEKGGDRVFWPLNQNVEN